MKYFSIHLLLFISIAGNGQLSHTLANKGVDSFVTAKMRALHILGMAIAVVKARRP